jgi:excisionase family DNA binding protein
MLREVVFMTSSRGALRNYGFNRKRFLMSASQTTSEARYLTIAAAAAYTSLSEDSIRRMLEVGKVTALRPVKGRILIDRQELDAAIRSSTATPRKGRGRNRAT